MNGNYGMYIGINGFGRIGKALFLQLLGEKICRVRAVNIPGFDVENMEQYLKFDSVHKKYTTNWKIGVIDDKSFYVDRWGPDSVYRVYSVYSVYNVYNVYSV